jgi:tetratricopeptide (TPR) repeat protein
LPTWAHNSSLCRFSGAIAALAKQYNVLFKPHHNNVHFEGERIEALMGAAGVKMLPDVTSIVPFLACADVVLADVRSGAFTEAFLLNRPTVGLSPTGDRGADNLLEEAYEAADVCAEPDSLPGLIAESLMNDPHREGRRRLAGWLFTDLSGQDDVVTAEAMIAMVDRHASAESGRGVVETSLRDDGGVSLLIAQGERLFVEGDLARACALFLDALKLDVKQATAWNNLGVALFAMDRLDEAQTALRRAMDLAPEDPDAFTNMAEVLLRETREAEALAMVKQALAIRPGNGAALGILARMGRA